MASPGLALGIPLGVLYPTSAPAEVRSRNSRASFCSPQLVSPAYLAPVLLYLARALVTSELYFSFTVDLGQRGKQVLSSTW